MPEPNTAAQNHLGGKAIPPIIEVKNLSKSFGPTKALIDVSLTVQPGESRALIGRNGAGKSTLVAMLTGMLRPTAGEILIGGVSAKNATSVSCVYQHSRLVPTLTVAENIVLSHYPRTSRGSIDWAAVKRIAREVLAPWELADLADCLVEDIAPVQKKVVEICRALSEKPQVLMLDEPTAGLAREEASQLFQFIDKLKGENVTLIYVSHHFDEIYRFCDSATILRDSRVVMTAPISQLPREQMIAAMMGNNDHAGALQLLSHDNQPVSEEIGLEVRHLCIDKTVRDVSFKVRRGECIGIAGLEGSGKTEIGAAIAGLMLPSAGKIEIEGDAYPLGDVPAALTAGIGYVPESRHHQGMVLSMSVAENSTLTALSRLAKKVLPGLSAHLSPSVVRAQYNDLARQWSIRASGPDQLISELSGGNQQKCVMARALATKPKVLILQNPTAGVDIAAKASIMVTLNEIMNQGASIVVISEDGDDFKLASRILVINQGQIGSELGTEWDDRSLAAAMQGTAPQKTDNMMKQGSVQ